MNKILVEKMERVSRILYERDAGVTAKCCEIWKNNGKVEGVKLHSKNHSCFPVVYPTGEWLSMDDVELAEMLVNLFEEYDIEKYIDMSQFRNKTYILDHVKPSVVSSRNLNDVINEGLAYTTLFDMVILFYFQVEVPGIDGIGTVNITNALMKTIGLDIEELLEIAKQNIAKEYEIIPAIDVLGEIPGEDIKKYEPLFMCIVTTKDRCQGAGTILSNQVMNELKKIYHDQFIIMPSSVQELMVVPYDEKILSFLHDTVCQINNTFVNKKDKLTDNLYIWKDEKLQPYCETR